jgi:rubrerythrin
VRATRRQLVGGAAILSLARTGPSAAATPADVAELERLLSLEQRLESAYRAALERDAVERGLGETLLDHEREHVRGLEQALRNRGGREPRATVPLPQAGAAFADRRAFARFALGLERRTVATYVSVLAGLHDERLLQPLASIMAASAQHEVALRAVLGANLLAAS